MRNNVFKRILSAVYPNRCPVCRYVIKKDEVLCKDCKKLLPKNVSQGYVVGAYRLLSAVHYDGDFAKAIKALKFGKKTKLAYPLSRIMAKRFENEGLENFDVITYVPLHKETFKNRGFNQSELLAKGLSKIFEIPCRELLIKPKKNKPQHTLSGKDREKNVKGVFKAVNTSEIKGRRIILVDDIATTRSTLGECSQMLSEKGAEDILCITFAISVRKTT